jgi:hypothetical protein
VIDSYFENFLDKKVTKSLIFHELGHCLLNKEHVNDECDYMNPFIPASEKKAIECENYAEQKMFNEVQ